MALAACVLWLVGVELMPALHEGMHDRLAPHRHDGGAIVLSAVTVSFEDTTHRHPDGSIHFVAPRTRPRTQSGARPPRDGRPRVSDPTRHADGLAHHAAALAPAAPPITRPLPIVRRPTTLSVARAPALVTRDLLAATARGPPTAA